MMTSKPKPFLYNEQVATQRLQVASVTISYDHRDPDTNRTNIARKVDSFAALILRQSLR
jgi:hypothetical protein